MEDRLNKGLAHRKCVACIFVSVHGLKSKLGDETRGEKETGKSKSWALSWGKLLELQIHEDDLTARTARKLQKAVKENPSKLLQDEAAVVKDMGIKVTIVPSGLRYCPKSG
ncbi:MAG: hypothetical protein ACFFER_13155 [Candidatus Thorarchaeota archaeon]